MSNTELVDVPRWVITVAVSQSIVGGCKRFFVRKGYDTAEVDVCHGQTYCRGCESFIRDRELTACRHCRAVGRALRSGRISISDASSSLGETTERTA